MPFLKTLIRFYLLLLLTFHTLSAEAKRIIIITKEDFLHNSRAGSTYIIETPINCAGRTFVLPPKSNLLFKKGGIIYNGSIIVEEGSKIKNGVFIVENGYSINDVIIIRGQGCRIFNTLIDGRKSASRFGISVFESLNTRIKNCTIKNFGTGVDNTAGIRMQGNCSNSVIYKTYVDNISATTNASGIVIQSSDNGNRFSNAIKITKCILTRITPETDGDGIKILQNHKAANHLIEGCVFIDCAKRAIKIQGLGVKCVDNSVRGGCTESLIDYQNGDCYIDGLTADNLGYVYAGIYIQGSEGLIYINNVEISADNTEKKYVKGIKIKRADWDANRQIEVVQITNCKISDFYQTLYIDGFKNIREVRVKDCSFNSVAHPFFINTSVEKFKVLRCKDNSIGGNRSSLYFPGMDSCKETIIDIKAGRE